jgi:uncharacterized membrane protein YgcG
MAEYYNVETRERRYSYTKPAGHGWVRADMFAQSQVAKDDDEGDSGLINTAIAAVEVGTVLAGLFDSGSGGSDFGGGSDFSEGGGDFGGGGSSGDF